MSHPYLDLDDHAWLHRPCLDKVELGLRLVVVKVRRVSGWKAIQNVSLELDLGPQHSLAHKSYDNVWRYGLSLFQQSICL